MAPIIAVTTGVPPSGTVARRRRRCGRRRTWASGAWCRSSGSMTASVTGSQRTPPPTPPDPRAQGSLGNRWGGVVGFQCRAGDKDGSQGGGQARSQTTTLSPSWADPVDLFLRRSKFKTLFSQNINKSNLSPRATKIFLSYLIYSESDLVKTNPP